VGYDRGFAAGVAELADAPDLGSGIERCAGSIPVARTNSTRATKQILKKTLCFGASFFVAYATTVPVRPILGP
jgi:hypothetical protein